MPTKDFLEFHSVIQTNKSQNQKRNLKSTNRQPSFEAKCQNLSITEDDFFDLVKLHNKEIGF